MNRPRIARLVAAAALVGVVALPASEALAAPRDSTQTTTVKSSPAPRTPIGKPVISPLSEGPWP